MQEYISKNAENCTPAQLQEIIYSLVIQNAIGQSELSFNKADVDRSISRINDKNRYQIGFIINDNHNGISVTNLRRTSFNCDRLDRWWEIYYWNITKYREKEKIILCRLILLFLGDGETQRKTISIIIALNEERDCSCQKLMRMCELSPALPP